MLYLLAVVLAYLIGSFPSGVVVVRIVRGFDVRRIGSRRSGATNVLRAAGPWSATAVFVLDVAKGALAVFLGQWLADSPWLAERCMGFLGIHPGWPLPGHLVVPLWVGLAAGFAAIAGHNWPVYVRFQGGRGVATALGTLIPLAWYVAAGCFLVGLAVVALTRYVSLGSVLGAALVPPGLLALGLLGLVPLSTILYGLAIAGVVIFQHRDNIGRLRAGTERKLGQKVDVPPAPQQPAA